MIYSSSISRYGKKMSGEWVDLLLIYRHSYFLLRNKGSASIRHSHSFDIQYADIKKASQHQETINSKESGIALNIFIRANKRNSRLLSAIMETGGASQISRTVSSSHPPNLQRDKTPSLQRKQDPNRHISPMSMLSQETKDQSLLITVYS